MDSPLNLPQWVIPKTPWRRTRLKAEAAEVRDYIDTAYLKASDESVATHASPFLCGLSRSGRFNHKIFPNYLKKTLQELFGYHAVNYPLEGHFNCVKNYPEMTGVEILRSRAKLRIAWLDVLLTQLENQNETQRPATTGVAIDRQSGS